jgi:hypothetical protein
MALKKDKQKVLGEKFDDERIKSFLNYEAPKGVDGDFHVLEKAYRGMREENFRTFLDFFTAAKRNINATNPEGQSLLDIASTHRHAEDYIAALKEHLAK